MTGTPAEDDAGRSLSGAVVWREQANELGTGRATSADRDDNARIGWSFCLPSV